MKGDTHCKRGHEWTEANTYRYTGKDGLLRRKCKTCTLRRVAERRAGIKPTREPGAPRPITARDDTLECLRVNRLLHLQEELDNETRAWLKPELQAEINALRDKLKDASVLERDDASD